MPYTVQILDAGRIGDEIAITGRVNRTAVDGSVIASQQLTVRVWKSHLDTMPQAADKKAYVRQQLKATDQATEAAGQTALIDAAPVET